MLMLLLLLSVCIGNVRAHDDCTAELFYSNLFGESCLIPTVYEYIYIPDLNARFFLELSRYPDWFLADVMEKIM